MPIHYTSVSNVEGTAKCSRFQGVRLTTSVSVSADAARQRNLPFRTTRHLGIDMPPVLFRGPLVDLESSAAEYSLLQ